MKPVAKISVGKNPPLPHTVKGWVRHGAKALAKAGLCFDNGLQSAVAEAEYLLFHVLALPFEKAKRYQEQPVTREQGQAFNALLAKRIQQRIPVHYLTQEAFFAGLRLYVDPRVLIPRSRIEILLDDPAGLATMAPPDRVGHILDLCTGSGCLAFALARLYPQARVEAADISQAALAVARINGQRLGLTKRVRLVHSDLFAGLGQQRYNLIVTNPPYVTRETLRNLPPEYHHEPVLALDGGANGLHLVETILRQAPAHLVENGLLICEVGDETETILRRKYTDLPLKWLHFYFGGSGVFAINQPELLRWGRGH